MKDKEKLSGIYYALFAAFISGISIFYNKIVLVKGIDPLIFNILKNGGVALILTIIIWLRGPLAFDKESPKTPWLKLVIIGIIGGSIPFLLFFQALVHVPAINANLIQKTLFIWVLIFSITFLKEKIKPIQIIGYLLVIAANFFIGGLTVFKFSQYELMIVLATLLWSLENIIAKKTLSNTGSNTVVWGRMFFGTIVLILIAVFSGKAGLFAKLNQNQILPVTGSIGLLTLYVSSWYKALKLAPATTVTAILVLATPVTNILSAVFITHNLNGAFNLNSLLLVLGVILIALFVPKFPADAQLLPQKRN